MSKGAFGKVDVLGMEVSGVVSECGDQVTMYKKGDAVMALLKDGGHAQYVSVDERHAIPIKGGISFELRSDAFAALCRAVPATQIRPRWRWAGGAWHQATADKP